MKIRIQWKDPDRPILDISGPGSENIPDLEKIIRMGDLYRLPDDIRKKLRAIGEDEYLVVEFDLEKGEGRVVKL